MTPNQPNNGPVFEEIGGGEQGTPFEPHATEKNGFAYHPQNPANVLEGYLKGSREVSTKYGPGVVWDIHSYNAKTGQLGPLFSLFQDTFLKDRLVKAPLNSFVHIEYKGKTLKKGLPPQPWSKTNSFHTWFVGQANGMPPYAQVLQAAGINPAAPKAPVQQQAPAQPYQGQNFNPPPPPQAQGQPQYQQQPNYQQQPQYQQAPVHNPPAQNTAPQAPAWTPPPPQQQQAQQAPPPPQQPWTPPAPTQPNFQQQPPSQPNYQQVPPQQPNYQQPPVQNGVVGGPSAPVFNPESEPPF